MDVIKGLIRAALLAASLCSWGCTQSPNVRSDLSSTAVSRPALAPLAIFETEGELGMDYSKALGIAVLIEDVGGLQKKVSGFRLLPGSTVPRRVWTASIESTADHGDGGVVEICSQSSEVLVCSPGGDKLLVVDAYGGTVVKEITFLGASLSSAHWSPDGRRILVAARAGESGGKPPGLTVVRRTDWSRSTINTGFSGLSGAFYVWQGSRIVALGYDEDHAGRVALIDSFTAKVLLSTAWARNFQDQQVEGSLWLDCSTCYRSLALSPDDEWIAVELSAGEVSVHSLYTGERRQAFNLQRSDTPAISLEFSPDGQSLSMEWPYIWVEGDLGTEKTEEHPSGYGRGSEGLHLKGQNIRVDIGGHGATTVDLSNKRSTLPEPLQDGSTFGISSDKSALFSRTAADDSKVALYLTSEVVSRREDGYPAAQIKP